MLNEVSVKLAMPIALVIFGGFVLTGMQTIARAIDGATEEAIQIKVLGLDKVNLSLEGGNTDKPIVIDTNLFK